MKTPQSIDHVTDKQIIKNHLLKIKQLNTSDLKTHQMEMIRCNKKLNFYFMFKTEVSKSEYLELIKNMTHRKALAKLRSGNHNLRIESGRHCIPKIPENLRICQFCSSNQIENEIHFLLYCNHFKNVRKHLTNDINLKYAGFDSLSEQDKIIFLFNNVDTCVCKKLGYFVYKALQIRNEYIYRQIHNRFQPIVL